MTRTTILLPMIDPSIDSSVVRLSSPGADVYTTAMITIAIRSSMAASVRRNARSALGR
jgi:hypothetical protein